MRTRLFIFLLILATGLGGCATGTRPSQPAVDEEWPTGIGTIPPEWYDYNPALKHWVDPWYHNPYIAR
jgi:hypothetical protein